MLKKSLVSKMSKSISILIIFSAVRVIPFWFCCCHFFDAIVGKPGEENPGFLVPRQHLSHQIMASFCTERVITGPREISHMKKNQRRNLTFMTFFDGIFCLFVDNRFLKGGKFRWLQWKHHFLKIILSLLKSSEFTLLRKVAAPATKAFSKPSHLL